MINLFLKIIFHPINKGKIFSSLFRFFKWQLFSRFYKYPILLPFTDSSNYLCVNGMTGLTGNLYFGLMEMEEMSFTCHILNKNDIFFDIGANVGSYTILTSQHTKCQVYCFEPHPRTFEFLSLNINVQKNPQLINSYNIALGNDSGIIPFSDKLDTENHISIDSKEKSINVKVEVLDYLKLPCPTLIKLDVEGFEYNVLKGSKNILKNPKLKAIIIEINGSGLKYGIEDKQIDKLLKLNNFHPYTYNPLKKKIIKLKKYLSHNTIYIRDLDFCKSRIQKSKPIKLPNGRMI